jgi:hypothetical protein
MFRIDLKNLASAPCLLHKPLVVDRFEQIEPICLPSTDATVTKASLKPAALEADVAAIRSALVEVVDQNGYETLVVAHSYGGTRTLYAYEGYSRARRNEKMAGL